MRERLTWAIEAVVAMVFVGVVSGVGASIFLHGLDWATDTRTANGWLLYLLPLVGLVVGLAYHYGAGRAAGGNNLVLDEIHEPSQHLPLRMAPLITVATIVTHLAGGSTGREGVAVQVAAGLSDQLPRAVKRHPAVRRQLLIIAIAGGFAAVFGTPIAAAVFACEVLTIGRLHSKMFVACLATAILADRTAHALGIGHVPMPRFPSGSFDLGLAGRSAVLGMACGVAALVFVVVLHGIKQQAGRIGWPPLRPMVGGAIVVLFVGLAGTRDYLGLSVPVGDLAVSGAAVGASMFAWKLAFTTVSLGSGLQGGEVTPLFVIGSTLAAALGPTLGVERGTAGMIGFVAVFAAASNTPVACTVLAVELFGGGALPYAAVACAVATLSSGRRSIYRSQRVEGSPL